MKNHVICTISFLLSVLLSAAGMARPAPVGMESDLVLLDLEKFQELPFRIYYPRNPGTYPAIILSHERGGDQSSREELSRAWSAEGFVCIVPSHQDPIPERLKDPRFTADIPASTATQAILKRVEDIRFILDSLEDIAGSTLPEGVRLDTGCVGLVGADWGAQVAQLMGGARLFHALSNEAVSFKDDRIRAFLLLDPPQDSRPFKATSASWTRFFRPLMIVAAPDCPPAVVKSLEGSFFASPAGNKSLLHIKSADHDRPPSPAKAPATSPDSPLAVMSFQPDAPRAPSDSSFDILAGNTLCFWEAFLCQDPHQLQRLKTGDIHGRGKTLSYHFHQ